jgi:ferritin-like metal-binding protein YciE
MTKKEMLLAWLNDAHAMESAKSDLMQRYSKDVDKYPDIQKKFAEGADIAREKTETLKGIIESLDGDTSAAKKIMGKISSVMQSAMSELMHDQPVKHMAVSYAGGHLAIASYTVLAAAGQELGEQEVVDFAQESIGTAREEIKWFEQRIPSLTVEFLRTEHKDEK